jgi:hypothetical protein
LALLLQFLYFYAAGMAVPLLMVGLFVGPQILAACVVHVFVAMALYLGRRGLLRRRRWAKWLLLLVSAPGAMVLPASISASLIETQSLDAELLILSGIITLLFTIVLFLTLSRPVRSWLRSNGLHHDLE